MSAEECSGDLTIPAVVVIPVAPFVLVVDEEGKLTFALLSKGRFARQEGLEAWSMYQSGSVCEAPHLHLGRVVGFGAGAADAMAWVVMGALSVDDSGSGSIEDKPAH